MKTIQGGRDGVYRLENNGMKKSKKDNAQRIMGCKRIKNNYGKCNKILITEMKPV